jgi:tetratricopeptide (TPR) repeat protein
MNKNIISLPVLTLLIINIINPATTYGEDAENLISNTERTESINVEAVNEAQHGDYDKAIKKFKNIVTLQDQNVASSYNNLGYTFLLKGDYQNAYENYRKAVDRNPFLVPAVANLGKMLYQLGKYQEAVVYGEKTLTLDPQNANVREWLPDAYKRAADKRMFDLNNTKKETKAEAEKQDNASSKDAKKSISKVEMYGIYELAYNKELNLAHHHAANTVLTIPAGLSAEIWASPEIEIIGEFKTPYLGLYIPYFIPMEENIGFIVHAKEFFYGVGAYFSQANFIDDWIDGTARFIHNLDYPKRNDEKLGVILGFMREFDSLTFYLYPRFLFQDMTTGPQSIEFDRSISKIEYRMIFPENPGRFLIPLHFELGVGFKTNEIFITEYNTAPQSVTLGHYFGAYDVYMDIAIGKIQPEFDKIPMQFGMIFSTRLYYQDLDNTAPLTIANGQGFFGFSVNSALNTGKTFPSYKTTSFLFDFYSRQLIMDKIIIMEKIGTELTGSTSTYNALSFALSAAYTF